MNIPHTVKENFKMPERTFAGRPVTSPLATLEIGQTVLFDVKSKKQITALRGRCAAYTARKGYRFITRTIGALPEAKFAVQRVRAKAK